MPVAKVINNALRVRDTSSREASDMTDLDPERFTLRQAAQARDDFAQIMDELDFVKEQLARLPTRRDQAFVPLKIMFGSAVIGAALVILWSDRSARSSIAYLSLPTTLLAAHGRPRPNRTRDPLAG